MLVAWLATAVAATVAGSLAVGAIGSGILPQAERPLSPEEVNDRLAQATSALAPASTTSTTPSTAAPTAPAAGLPLSPPAPPATQKPGLPEVFPSRGGTVIARCAPGPQILSATPAQGYQLKDVQPDNGAQRVRFETGGSGHNNRVELLITCPAGHPTASIR